ncbi:MAG: SRPBCC family protein [Acidimicrobiia bacterium]
MERLVHQGGTQTHGWTPGGSPIQFTNTVHIERDVEEVFDFLSDLENTPVWNWAIVETEKLTPGPVRAGTRYTQTRSVPFESTEELEISDLAENELIVVEGTLAKLRACLEYRLQCDDTGTLLENRVELNPPRGLGFLGRALASRIQDSVTDNLGELKYKLESR